MPSDPDARTIARVPLFDIEAHPHNPKYKVIDKGTPAEITIKETLGKGSFCKVKEAEAKVIRILKDKQSGEEKEVEGVQHMAFKVFNKPNLQQQKTSEPDPVSGLLKMSDQLQSVY